MAPGVVSPHSEREFASQVIVTIVLFTVFRLHVPLIVRSVLDMCLAKALYSVLSTLSALCSFITNTALKFPSIAATLGTRLSDVVSSAIQLYLPLSLFSRIVAAINPYIPEPPIQLCVLGSGIHCDAVRHRPTISDLADQLVCHLVGLVQSSCGALFDSFYRTLSVPYGVVTDWLFSLFDSAFFFLDSLWVLKIFNTPLDGEELYATDKGSASLAIVCDKIFTILN